MSPIAPLNPLAGLAPDDMGAPSNALAGSPVFGTPPTAADAWDRNSKIYGDFVAKERASGIQAGLLDPETGWPTGAALVDAAHQYGSALIGGTAAPGMKGAALMPGENTLAGPAPGIRGYHGSPHSFDQFDLGKIGTGEGAQAYGHGLYFAENEGVARGYRDRLADGPGRQVLYDGTPVISTPADPYQPIHTQMTPRDQAVTLTQQLGQKGALKQAKSDIAYLAKLNKGGQEMMGYDPAQHAPWYNSVIDEIKGVDPSKISVGAGHMYEVNINANPEHMLDWDKPRDQLAQPVQDFAKAHTPQAWENAADGSSLYHGMARELGSHADVSAAMARAGIPGIRYLDGGSRADGQGTRNHVVFDAKTIEVLRKYGIAGLMAGSAAAASGKE